MYPERVKRSQEPKIHMQMGTNHSDELNSMKPKRSMMQNAQPAEVCESNQARSMGVSVNKKASAGAAACHPRSREKG